MMRVLLTLGFFFVLSVAQCEWGIQDPTTGAIYNYSLSSLQGQLINVVEEATGQVATVHFCGIAPRCTTPTVACLDTKLDPDLYVALGNKTSWTVAPFLQANSGFFAHISDGDSCDPITSYRSAKFELTCNPNGPLIPSAPRLFEDVPCHYVFQMSSSAFCPVFPDDGDDFDPGWIFVIVISSVFLTYLIVGSIIWRFVLRKETWIVHQDFWEYVYVCVLDGLALVFCCRKRKLEYQAVL